MAPFERGTGTEKILPLWMACGKWKYNHLEDLDMGDYKKYADVEIVCTYQCHDGPNPDFYHWSEAKMCKNKTFPEVEQSELKMAQKKLGA